jgi:proline racemase
MVRAEQTHLALVPENAGRLAALGMRILEHANARVQIQHPYLPHIDRIIDLRFYEEPGPAGANSRNVVVLGNHMVDRSPCGTGTCAELALQHMRGRLAVGRPWVVQSIIGTRFIGEIVAETSIGQGASTLPAVIQRVTGSAYLTGRCQWLLDSRDPFPTGFALGTQRPG